MVTVNRMQWMLISPIFDGSAPGRFDVQVPVDQLDDLRPRDVLLWLEEHGVDTTGWLDPLDGPIETDTCGRPRWVSRSGAKAGWVSRDTSLRFRFDNLTLAVLFKLTFVG